MEPASPGDHAAVGARCLTCGGRAAGPSRPLARRVAVDAQPVMSVCSATTLIGPTRLAVRLAGAGSGRAWRGDEERAAEREEQEQRRGDSLCENLRARRHWFPPLCVGHTDRGCGWLLPMGLKDSHGRMPLPFMAGSPWVRREHRPGAGPTSRTVFAALDRTLSGARLCGLCVCRGRGGSAFGPETKHLTPPESAPSENAAAASWLGTMGRWDRPARCGVCTRGRSRCRRRWAHKRCSVLHSPARPTKAVRVALVGLRCARCRWAPITMPARDEAT